MVIIFDNRGIGVTIEGNKTVSMNQSVNDMVGLIDALEIKKVNRRIGSSLGEMIAQELALSKPEKIKSFYSCCFIMWRI